MEQTTLLNSATVVFLVIMLAACQRPTPAPGVVPVFVEDFESSSDGATLANRLTRHERLSVVDGVGRNESRGLKARYEGYPRGSRRIVVEYDLGERGMAYTLCYDVKFDKDFQFVRGGKIMGLGPDDKVTGGNKVTMGGWSARSNFAAEGGVHTYIYSQNKTGKWGESVHSSRPVFEKDRFHTVTLQVRLNDPVGAANGISRIYVDGRLAVDHDNIQFRGVEGDSTLISSLLFETFHGGNTENFAPRDENGDFATVYSYFDNIAVYRGFYLCP